MLRILTRLVDVADEMVIDDYVFDIGRESIQMLKVLLQYKQLDLAGIYEHIDLFSFVSICCLSHSYLGHSWCV